MSTDADPVRCPGCGRTGCALPRLECGGEPPAPMVDSPLIATARDWSFIVGALASMQAERDQARAETDAIRTAIEAVATEWETDRDVCVARISDETQHEDAGHPARLSQMADLLNRQANQLRAAITPSNTQAKGDSND